MKKNIEKSEAPTRSPTALAPVSVRNLKIRKGINGSAERRSMKMKETISAAATPSRAIVCVEPQPALLASTRA
jgi:hypothetical protein